MKKQSFLSPRINPAGANSKFALMKKGEIVLLELPLSNGHEQIGLRPAIIFSEEIGKMIVVVPLTTKTSALKYPFTINIENSKLNGLKEIDCLLIKILK